METSYFTFPFLLVALSFFLSLCAQMTGNFKCNGSPSTCLSLVGYSSRNSTTLGNIQTLFSVKNLPLILEANSLPLSTTRAERVNPDQVVLIPIPCSCSDGTGVSNRVPVYTVKMSDTLFYIASEIFGGLVSFQKISEMNSITELIGIGQKLWIPLPCSCDKLDGQNVVHYAHMVKQGSTLGEIAAQFKTDITTLERLNDISGDTQLLADYPLNVALRVDERYTHCAPKFRCGNLTYLYYPFWTPEREECGHPDFKVNCSGDFAEFSKSSVKFRILEMNYDYDTIRLVRMDYINNLCPQNPENATVNQQVLPFSRDTELVTFYYTCPDSMVNILPNGYIQQINCEVNIGGRSYFDSSRSNSTSCERNVNIPVSRSALKIAERNQSREAMKKALDDGFELNFSSDCSGCVRSGGACGHNKGSGAFVCYCIDGNHEHTCHFVKKSRLSRKVKIGIGLACGFLGTVSIAIGLVIFKISLGFRKRETSHYPRNHDLKALLQLKQYSYAKVRKITKSFSHTIGKGGFGIVYGGNLRDGRKVAVKILKDFKSNGEDFINEVASISQTSHVNIVSLLGFCYEGSKRAIVYEFLENGSLDQFISKKKSLNLDVSTLYGIALGVARGLEYLHHGCKTRIVHFDIKPQNVLLDDNLCPKVSDFGLAKLCQKRESILSLLDARGTIGYIAPEVFSGMYGRVSHKSDVYSYGMLVLEIVGVRNKETVGTTTSNCSSSYFPDWIYKDLENGEHIWKFGDDKTREEKEIAKKMTLVGLWCIQSCPSNRPPMNRVVEMMEGSLDALEVPPKPSLHLSAAPLAETSWLSEENSSHI